jgi:hypothetical protein
MVGSIKGQSKLVFNTAWHCHAVFCGGRV